ncbi:MAG: DUF87 domain-containing protein [Solirubrobacteraceae bacterium]|nr:DUF87 domain-containing protein [Solirubrobacteraceae bacterium]
MSDPWPVLLTGAAALAVVSVGTWAVVGGEDEGTCREALFPDDFSSEQMEALLRQIASGRGRPVQLVVDARGGSLRFFLLASRPALHDLSAVLSGIAPGVRLQETSLEAMQPLSVARLGWASQWPLLRTEQPEALVAGLLGSMADASHQGHVRLVVRLWPVRTRPGALSPNARDRLPGEQARAIRMKAAGALLRVEIVVAAHAGSAGQAAGLIERVKDSLRAATGPRGRLRHQKPRLRTPEAALSAPSRLGLGELRSLLSPAELVALTGWPIGAPQIVGLSYGVGPRLAPPQSLPRRGRVFGTSSWPGSEDRPLAQPVVGGLQHAAIIGPTGSGKSSLVANLALQDIEAGRGVLVLDGKGDLVDDILDRLPDSRRDDLIVLDPARDQPQPGLRLFSRHSDPEHTADVVLGTLQPLFADHWGVRTEHYLRLALVTLAAAPGTTVMDLPLLFADARFRLRVLRHVSDPLVLSGWQRFEALSPADQAAQIAPALTKIEQLLGRKSVRVVVGQEHPKLHFGEVLARGRIILVRLPRGLLGTPATRLLAALTLWQFVQAVEARAALPTEQRRPFLAYLDELSALDSLPLPIDDLLERARGLGVGLTLSPQSLDQLPIRIRKALLANVATLVAFRQRSSEEATALARELPGVSSVQLQHLDPFEVAIRLGLSHGVTSPVMTARTTPLSESNGTAESLRQHAASRWGTSIGDVDAAFAERHGITTNAAAAQEPDTATEGVGRRRRTS